MCRRVVGALRADVKMALKCGLRRIERLVSPMEPLRVLNNFSTRRPILGVALRVLEVLHQPHHRLAFHWQARFSDAISDSVQHRFVRMFGHIETLSAVAS